MLYLKEMVLVPLNPWVNHHSPYLNGYLAKYPIFSQTQIPRVLFYIPFYPRGRL
jgi:hypothetical protein